MLHLHEEPEFGELTKLAASMRLSEGSFQALLYRLSPRQRRFFLLLAEEGVASTSEVRSRCGTGNPSDSATAINRKLAAAGDPRRIVCEVRAYVDQYGDRSVLGHWRLLDTGKPAANDPTV